MGGTQRMFRAGLYSMVPVDTCHYTLVHIYRMPAPRLTVRRPCGSSAVGNAASGGDSGSRGGCAWGGQELHLSSLYLSLQFL